MAGSCVFDSCPVTDLGGGTDDGECGAEFTHQLTADCDFECDPPSGFFPVGTTFVECITEDDDQCQYNVVITDDEVPTVGTIEPLDECYPSTTAAIDDAKAAILAAADDNCAVVDVIVKTSAINTMCQWAAQLVAVDAATPPNESAVVHVGAIIDGEDPVTGPFMVEDCYDSVEAAEEAIEGAIRDATTDNCPGELEVNVDCELVDCTLTCDWGVGDACGNSFVSLDPIVVSIDAEPPVITCPPDITVSRGDRICNNGVENWLDSATATDNCPARMIYDTGQVAHPIPHFGTTSHFLDVPDSFDIADLDVGLAVSHPAVGELNILLRHGGRAAFLTAPPLGGGCDNANYNVLIDDEGTGGELQQQCMDNLMSPPSYTPHSPLSFFNGLDAQGQWELFIFDTEPGNSGVIVSWNLQIEKEVPITNNAADNGFECGFPAGTTTEVEFKATDGCGNMDTCTSTITVEPESRVAFDAKGSLLLFSKVEVQWDAAGNLIQDTFLDVTNDYPDAVGVQAYYINGDVELEEITDGAGNITQVFEPGWNTADCRFTLTANQPHYWSAARGSDKCQPFTVLDEDGPGRPDGEINGPASRILRGYVIMWAVEFNPEENLWEEIRWNHLKGDAVIVNYANGTAWEYNAWATQASCGAHGEPLLDCTRFDENGVCCEAEVIPGNLDLDGFQYDVAFDQLILDFYGSGSDVFSGGQVTASVDTDLTVHAVSADLRQDGCGPVLTKIEAEIWNEFETKFSGTRRCICCWDQTMLSDWVRSEAIPNHFKRSALRTDKGKARLDGVYSVECDYAELCGETAFQKMWSCGRDEMAPPYSSFSEDAAILGLATKFIAFSGGITEHATAGMNLVGSGREAGTIRADIMFGAEELRGMDRTTVRPGSTDRAGEKDSRR